MKNKFLLVTIVSLIISMNTQAQETGTFTDSRDGKVYKTVQIGKQVWMAENLAYKPSSVKYWAYANNTANVSVYGYLYGWETAEKVCPSDWHLPSKAEFDTLLNNFGGSGNGSYVALKKGGTSEFNALFGGCRGSLGTYHMMDSGGLFWSSTECGSNNAWGMDIHCDFEMAGMNYDDESIGRSVRCLKD